MSGHTPGAVMHDTRGYPHPDVRVAGEGRAVAVTWMVCRSPTRTQAAHLKRQAEDRANARRIVACWNYCQGLTTEELEASVARGDEWEPEAAA